MSDNMFIDAKVVLGHKLMKSCSIEVYENSTVSSPLNLNGYSVRLRILGAPTANAKILKEYIITQNTDFETEGQIDNPDVGQFTFVVPAQDTIELGLGQFPIELALLDAVDRTVEFLLTEGDYRGQFNKIQIVQC